MLFDLSILSLFAAIDLCSLQFTSPSRKLCGFFASPRMRICHSGFVGRIQLPGALLFVDQQVNNNPNRRFECFDCFSSFLYFSHISLP